MMALVKKPASSWHMAQQTAHSVIMCPISVSITPSSVVAGVGVVLRSSNRLQHEATEEAGPATCSRKEEMKKEARRKNAPSSCVGIVGVVPC